MEFLESGLFSGSVIVIIIVAIIMFFAPLIIIAQLGTIIGLLRRIGYDMNKNQDELIFTNNRIARTQSAEQEKNDKRVDELLNSLFQDEKNTPD